MDTKKCIACKEEIPKEALKCKHCLQIQTKAANLQNQPLFNYMVIALLGIFIVWVFYYIISVSLKDPLKPTFQIDSSELHLTIKDENLNIRCIGNITNPTLKRWSDFSLQALFKNSDGEVIDVLYSEPEVTLYPAFSFVGIVTGEGSAASSEYNSCGLSVVNADAW
jgi:predicted nucleic acid-binding Zn ribbon protein